MSLVDGGPSNLEQAAGDKIAGSWCKSATRRKLPRITTSVRQLADNLSVETKWRIIKYTD